jgi:VanZ family protein
VLVLLVVRVPQPAGRPSPWLDEAAHAGLFFVQALLLGRAFQLPPGRRRPVAAAVITSGLYGVATELLQAALPHREAALGDAAADAAGALTYGLWVALRTAAG